MLQVKPQSTNIATLAWNQIPIGEIRINLRDAMIFMDLNENIQIDPDNILQAIKPYLVQDWGGKTLLTMPQQFYKSAVVAGFNLRPTVGNVMYFTVEELKGIFERIAKEPGAGGKRIENLQQIQNKFQQAEFKLLTDKNEITALSEKIFNFLQKNTNFVTPQKIEQGLYSKQAIELRINNEIVSPYVIVDSDQVVATTFINEQTNELVYVSDVVVREDLRKKVFLNI